MKKAMDILRNCDAWNSAYEIQRDTVIRFHQECADVLGDACALEPLPDDALSMRRNLFSTLFTMSNATLGLDDEELRFYAVVNQCLRALVTGCDNILDDEYKEVIGFSMPGKGIRFRSVLTIMTADAVLARLIAGRVAAGKLELEKAMRLSEAVLAVLIPSGIEEHEEESELGALVPTVEDMLERIHFLKTGMLFQAPLRIVEHMDDANAQDTEELAGSLSRFGIGCQILDDMKDVAEDLMDGRYNLVLSEAYHGKNTKEREAVSVALQGKNISKEMAQDAASSLKRARRACTGHALEYFLKAHKGFLRSVPSFGLREARALGMLVQASIMKERNDLIAKANL